MDVGIIQVGEVVMLDVREGAAYRVLISNIAAIDVAVVVAVVVVFGKAELIEFAI